MTHWKPQSWSSRAERRLVISRAQAGDRGGRAGRKPLSPLLTEQGCVGAAPRLAASTTEGECPPKPRPQLLEGPLCALWACVCGSPPCSLLTLPGPVSKFPVCEGTPPCWVGSPKTRGELPWALSSKDPACSAGDMGSIPRLGRSPGEGNGSPLQCSCLESPTDGEPGGLQRCNGVAKSQA